MNPDGSYCNAFEASDSDATIICPECDGWVNITKRTHDELLERNRMLSDIALSAIALKINIEHGFPPALHALNRDLAAFQKRFGGVVDHG